MAEEEESFTFVDKRRTHVDLPPDIELEGSIVNAPVAEAAGEIPANEEHRSPGTYDLIGYCLNLMASQAWQKLGLLADPQTGETEPNLDEAKVAIDTVVDLAARLETAPTTEVPSEMRRELKVLLNDLRLNYVARRGDPT